MQQQPPQQSLPNPQQPHQQQRAAARQPMYAPAAGSRSPPPPLDTQQSHARYSSADLYALQQHSPVSPGDRHQRPSVDASRRLTSNAFDSDRDDNDSDDDEDDGPGFASHGDLDTRSQRRTSSVQQLQQLQAQPSQPQQYHVPFQQYQGGHYSQPYPPPAQPQHPVQRTSMPLPPPIVS